MAEPRDPREPRIPKETPPFDADNKWTRTWIMYFESLFTLSVKEAVRQAGTVTHTSGDLTKDLPVFGNDKADVKVGTKSGNTNEVATVTGAVVTGNTVKWDANGNLIDAGVAPGGGGGGGTVTHTGGALTADQPVFGAGSADIKVGTKTGNTNKLVTNTGTNVTGNTVKWDASGNLIDAGVTPGGGTGGTPAYISSLIAGPDTTKTITGATHGYATAGLLVQVYDNASPRNAIAAGWTVNASTFDVIVTFASAQSNYYIVINGATGPAGPTGPPGSGSGTVTSVALTVPAEFSVSGSPVTTSGTLAVSKATQSANIVYAGPTTGSAAAPTFRAVVPADLPLASSSAFGAVKVDGTTITAASGVISAAGGGGGSYPLTFVQQGQYQSGASNTTSFTVTFPQAVASSGNTMFLFISCDGSTAVTIPSGWTSDLNVQQNTYARFILCHRATASQTSTVITVASASSFSVYFFEVAGSHALDQSSTGGTANAAFVTLPAITPTANSVVFGVAAMVYANGSDVKPYECLSPAWKGFGIFPTQSSGRALLGFASTVAASAVATTPPQINFGFGLFASGGIAYATFSIV